MRNVTVEASARVGADADLVYDFLSDYQAGHPAILPPQYFTGLTVERGGRGAGTRIRFGMKLLGRVRETTAEVAEPDPGRVLTETTQDAKRILTTFTVEPVGDRSSRVTIRSEWAARGLPGLIERLLAPAMLRRVYVAELARLDSVARQRQAQRDPR